MALTFAYPVADMPGGSSDYFGDHEPRPYGPPDGLPWQYGGPARAGTRHHQTDDDYDIFAELDL